MENSYLYFPECLQQLGTKFLHAVQLPPPKEKSQLLQVLEYA